MNLFTGPIIPQQCNCIQGAGWQCLVQVIGNISHFVIAIGIFASILLIAYAGFLWVINVANPSGREQANNALTNAVIGLVITLAAWLLVNTLLTTLTKYTVTTITAGVLVNSGPCLPSAANPTPIQGAATSSGTSSTTPGGGDTTATSTNSGSGGDIPAKICSAAQAYEGQSTAAGPGGGRVACAWAMNNVLTNAGIANIGSTAVSGVESALQGGRGMSESQGDAVCGDIVIQAGDSHVGICLNSGCSQVISNSSSKATFSWISGPDFSPSYSGGIGRFYRVTN